MSRDKLPPYEFTTGFIYDIDSDYGELPPELQEAQFREIEETPGKNIMEKTWNWKVEKGEIDMNSIGMETFANIFVRGSLATQICGYMILAVFVITFWPWVGYMTSSSMMKLVSEMVVVHPDTTIWDFVRFLIPFWIFCCTFPFVLVIPFIPIIAWSKS